MQSHTKQIAMLSLFAALAIGIHGLESLIPALIPIPGIKLGLANIITLIVLKKYDFKSAALVLTVRIFLSAILFGGMMSFAYSAFGGAVCLTGEYLIDRFFKGKALYITAIFGAVLHNAAQLLVAIGFTNTPGVLLYAPYLVISGIVTGLLTGVAAYFSLKLLEKV
ncbi:MAG: Gx transporter family protein [Lachnospiraceae bacterium]|nr:Gx transporter family protein [Lachnospiraceae bacterium]